MQVRLHSKLLLLLLRRAAKPGLITQMFCREKARSAEAPLVIGGKGEECERARERNGK